MNIIKRIAVVLSMLISVEGFSQYVSIPDSNFGYWLNANGYASCVTGNSTSGYQLDTTCPSVLSAVTLNLVDYTSNLDGLTMLHYFKHVDSIIIGTNFNMARIQFPASLKYLSTNDPINLLLLPDSLQWLKINQINGDSLPSAFPSHLIGFDCSNSGSLNFLPTLPNTLRYLNLYDVEIGYRDSILTFPDSLRYLNCWGSQLAYIGIIPPFTDTLICAYNQLINNLPSLPTTLRYLDCSFDGLSSLPTLTPSLTYLDCSQNQNLSLIPALPTTLIYLDCSYNSISIIPTLPSGLLHLSFSYNQARTWPTLPALTYLEASANPLHTLPSSLPTTLTYLGCSYDSLSAIPTLPSGLAYLYCNANLLTALPALPAHLQNLSCQYNRLASLPTLPGSISTLYCDSNLLTQIPPLGSVMITLSCEGNHLTSLPNLPDTLSYLNCSYNPDLNCLPVMGGYLTGNVSGITNQGFYIAGTGINCIPQTFGVIPNYDIDPHTLPICTPSSGCNFYYNIIGNVHLDTSSTCLSDSLNPGPSLVNMKVNLLHDGQVVQQCYISQLGQYSFKTDTFTDYIVQLDTSSLVGLSSACPSSASRSFTLSASDSVVGYQNFGMSCSPVDYAALSIHCNLFHPTFTRQLNIVSGNASYLRYGAQCDGGLSGTVTTILSGPVSYAGPAAGALTPTSVSGNILSYDISNLDSLNSSSLNVMVTTDSSAVIDSSVCITSIITPTTPDANVSDDTLTQCFTVSNSLDPNLKTVYPATLSPDGGWLTYTIEFQNTGNDTAYTVVIRDTLSPYIDATSFQYITSDHKAVIQLMVNAMTFTFPRINLVDSATNAPLSTGWIQYRVKAKPNLPLNTQVKNTAYVYFDINPAIITNTTINTVDTVARVSGINKLTNANMPSLYPNPNKGTFTLQTSGSIGSSYVITDMLGHIISQQSITADRQGVDMRESAEGVYILTVKGTQPLRFTVMK